MAGGTSRTSDQWSPGTTMTQNNAIQLENQASTKPTTELHMISLILSSNLKPDNQTNKIEGIADNSNPISYRINADNNGNDTVRPREDRTTKSSAATITGVVPKDGSAATTNHRSAWDGAKLFSSSTRRFTWMEASSGSKTFPSFAWTNSTATPSHQLTPRVVPNEEVTPKIQHRNNSPTSSMTTKLSNSTHSVSFPYDYSTHRFTIFLIVICSLLALLLPLVMVVLKKFFNKGSSNIKHRKLKSFPRDLLLASTGFDEAGKGETAGNKVAQTPFIEPVDKQKQAREKLYLAENTCAGGSRCKHELSQETYRIMSDSNMILGWKSRKTYPSKQRHNCHLVSEEFMFLPPDGDQFQDVSGCTSYPEESSSVRNCPLHQTRISEASDNFFHISSGRASNPANDYQNWTNDHVRNFTCGCTSKSEKTCSSTSSGYSTESSAAHRINELFQLSKVYDSHQEALDAGKLSLLPLKYTIANQHASEHSGEERESQLVEIPLDSPPSRRKFIDIKHDDTCDNQIKHALPRREKLFSLTLLNATLSQTQEEQKSFRAQKIISSKPKFPKMGRICLMNQPKPTNAPSQNGPITDELYNNYKSLSSTTSSSSSSKSCNAGKSPASANSKCQIYASIKDNDYSGGYSQLLKRCKDSEENVYCEIIKNKCDEIRLEEEKCADRGEHAEANDSNNKNGDSIDEENKGIADYVNLPRIKSSEDNEIYRSCEAPQKHSFSSKFYRYSFLNNTQYTPLVEKDAEKEAILLETDDEDNGDNEPEMAGANRHSETVHIASPWLWLFL